MEVPSQFLNRRITRQTLREVSSVHFPAFIKPVTPKQFRGAIYKSSEAVLAEFRGLPLETAVFVSEPVTFSAEVRAFVLGGRVLDAAVYEGEAGLSGAVDFVGALTKSIVLPLTVVIDVGLADGRGWAVIEFNTWWGAGLNGCDAAKVLPAIVSATGELVDMHD